LNLGTTWWSHQRSTFLEARGSKHFSRQRSSYLWRERFI
jgi:hypothetical protein